MTGTEWLKAAFANHPWAYTTSTLLALGAAAWLANWVTRRLLLKGFNALQRVATERNRVLQDHGVAARLANIVPAMVIWMGVAAVPNVPEAVITVVRNVSSAFIMFSIALAIANFLNLINAVYSRRPEAASRPIKGYLEVLKIIVYGVAVILMIAALVDRSPVILLSGLGAMAAVLMLIFQDTILSLVASVQISSNDVVRVGDWIEMPHLNADGDVIDIALHTVKVQNWDKTITTVPTRKLISEPVKNWRGMQQSGGRRIKRSIHLDQNSVRFLTDEEQGRFHRFSLLTSYLQEKEEDIREWNARLPERSSDLVNTRRVTNLGTFRAYVERYLRSHPGIHQGMTLMVRQLAPGSEGLPLEIYCFTNTVAWVGYEGIQADIFDHLLAILPEFGLRVYQRPAGSDLRAVSELDFSQRTQLTSVQ